MAFLDSKIHTRLVIVTGNEFGLALPLGTFPKNFVQIRPRFYRAMLCIRGTSHGPVSVRPSVRLSVCLSVRHKSVFY